MNNPQIKEKIAEIVILDNNQIAAHITSNNNIVVNIYDVANSMVSIYQAFLACIPESQQNEFHQDIKKLIDNSWDKQFQNVDIFKIED